MLENQELEVSVGSEWGRAGGPIFWVRGHRCRVSVVCFPLVIPLVFFDVLRIKPGERSQNKCTG